MNASTIRIGITILCDLAWGVWLGSFMLRGALQGKSDLPKGAVTRIVIAFLFIWGSVCWMTSLAAGAFAGRGMQSNAPLEMHREFGAANFIVVILYFIAMLGIGYWAGRRVTGTRGFFLGDSKQNFVIVGLSILGTYLSALTMMALPGIAFGDQNFTWSIQLPFLVITAFVITKWVLPRYREAGVVSVYEYLEQKIHVSSRMLASLGFIAMSVGRMGLVLFLPALAFSIVTGFDLTTTIIVMGLVVVVYTVMGGMEGVIWTDAIQVVIFVAAAIVTVAYVLYGVGLHDFWTTADQMHKFQTLKPGFNIKEIVTVWLVLQTIFETIRIYGTQQDITQRYMTTASTAEANRSVWIAILGYIPLGYLFYFIGAALAVYFKQFPDPNVQALVTHGRADAIYPYFVVAHFPQGIAGLVIAGIFAAAMSSISSSMNSCSTVCVEDFYRRFISPDVSDEHALRVARRLTVFWGAMAILWALIFINMQSAQILWSKIMGVATNGVLGLMALAFLPCKVHKWAAIGGFILCYLVVGPLMLWWPKAVNFLLWPVIGNLVCFGGALLLNATIFRPEDGITA